jgi:hypothetical protein
LTFLEKFPTTKHDRKGNLHVEQLERAERALKNKWLSIWNDMAGHPNLISVFCKISILQ